MNLDRTATDRSTRNGLLAALLATIVFDQLFWHETIGVNLSLFALLIVVLITLRSGWRDLSGPAKWTGLGVLVSAFMLTWHGSTIACFSLIASLTAFAGLAHASALRTHLSAIVQYLGDTLAAPIGMARSVGGIFNGPPIARKTWRWSKLVLLPLLIVMVYFYIYRSANSKFDALTAGFLDTIGQWIDRFFREVFTPHALFFLFGLVVCSGLLLRFGRRWLEDAESAISDRLVRVREKRPHWLAPLNMGALGRELRMGIVLLVMVNALLLLVNIIDIHWVWFGFEVEPGMSLKEFVHEGTWLLIVSILLSMGILFHLFRRNLNFHPRNRMLRLLAHAWIAQNFILGISVFLRNYHYIAFHGLAYRRIGVIVFLVLMLVGLITLAMKIRDRRSFFYLMRINGWAAFVVMIFLGTVDWDTVIVRCNLHHWNQGEIDVDNYLAMSDKVLPLLYDDVDRVRAQMAK